MVTEQTPIVDGEDEEGTAGVPAGTPSKDPNPNAELRAHTKRVEATNDQLRGRIMTSDLEAIGLVPGEGLGLAITETFKGELTEDAVATFARDKYSYDSGVTPQVPESVAAGDRLETALQTSESTVPAEIPLPGQAAIDKMDANDPEATRQDAIASIQAKSALAAEAFYPNQ